MSIEDGSDPEPWLRKMLAVRPEQPVCPERLRGVLWMEGNTAPEMLLTLEDAVWSTDGTKGAKVILRNWSRSASCCGLLLQMGVVNRDLVLTFEVSPGGKWIALGPVTTGRSLIYIVQEEDVFVRPDGSTVGDLVPGDMVRVTYNEPFDQESGLAFQYKLRRLAFADAEGRLHKTEHWNRYLERTTGPLPNQPCISYLCCAQNLNRGTGGKSVEKIENLAFLSRRHVVIFAPPPPNQGVMPETMERA